MVEQKERKKRDKITDRIMKRLQRDAAIVCQPQHQRIVKKSAAEQNCTE
jgi:hypothetical protein